jgi:hypothetical protein
MLHLYRKSLKHLSKENQKTMSQVKPILGILVLLVAIPTLKSALVGKTTLELYCDLDGLQAPGGGFIPADVMVQAQRPDLVIIDRSVHARHRIALVKLTCSWETDAKRAEERKTARYADLKIALSIEGWDCSLYLIEVGARGHIIKLVKDRLRLLFWAWVTAGYRSGTGQMMKDVSRISLVCLFAIFQARNDPVWFSPQLVTRHCCKNQFKHRPGGPNAFGCSHFYILVSLFNCF